MSRKNWVSINWLKALVSILATAICVLTYLLLAQFDSPPSAVRFVQEMLPATAVVLLTYLVGNYLLFRRGISSPQQLREEVVEAIVEASQPAPGVAAVYTAFGEPPWATLWSEATRVQLVARYFDGVVHPIGSSIETFWRHPNASVDVVVPDPRQPAAIRFRERPQEDVTLYEDDYLGRILRSLWALEQCRREQGGAEGSLQVYLASGAVSYSGYCFDGEQLLLSPYEYQHDPINRAPRSHFLLSQNQGVARFWQEEMKSFTSGAAFDFDEVKAIFEKVRQREGAQAPAP